MAKVVTRVTVCAEVWQWATLLEADDYNGGGKNSTAGLSSPSCRGVKAGSASGQRGWLSINAGGKTVPRVYFERVFCISWGVNASTECVALGTVCLVEKFTGV